MKIAVTILNRITKHRASSFLGLVCVAVSSFFMMGYLFDKPNYYTWPRGGTPVALPTSLLFITLGSAIVMLAARSKHLSEHEDADRLKKIEETLRHLPCQPCPKPQAGG